MNWETPGAGQTMGRKPYVTLLLRFADSPHVEPQPASYFERLQGSEFPEVGHYFRTASHGQVDLSGYRVLDWRTLPGTRAAYQLPDGGFDLLRALHDATALADPEVRFSNYSGIHLVFNEVPFPHSGYAAVRRLRLDGRTQSYGITWQAPFYGTYSQATWVHETGHTFGLPHSSGPYNATYDSRWDMMSDSFSFFHAPYQWIAGGTIGYHMQLAGWIPRHHQRNVRRGETRTFTLHPLAAPILHPPQSHHPHLIRLPLERIGRRFYTLEARTQSGYDASLPGSGVVIHAVNTARFDRVAQVVDPDGNGDPNDDGALWTPGETFTDPANGIEVAVEDCSAEGWTVTIRREGGLLVAPPGLQFDRTPVGSSRAHRLLLRNDSPTESLTVHLGTPKTPFAVNVSQGPHVLPPRGHLRVPVTFSPQQPGSARASLTLTSSDPRRRTTTIRLRGVAR